MGRIAVLVPTDDMVHLAHNILQEGGYDQIQEVIKINTEDSVSEARQAAARGASVIVARGLQASMIRRYTDIHVVEIVVTAQEMALVIQKAKQLVKKERPAVAVAGTQNMFCDMSCFEEIFNITLNLFLEKDGGKLEEAAVKAAESGADIVIGGDLAIEAAKAKGLPSLFMSITEDSLRNAFRTAEIMEQVIQKEKLSQAKMEILLDSQYIGTMNFDRDGRVTYMNGVMEQLLERKKTDTLGMAVEQLFQEADREQIQAVCLRKQAAYSLLASRRGRSLLCTFTPVVVDEAVDSIFMSCQMLRRNKETEAQRAAGTERGMVHPLFKFADLPLDSEKMKQCIAKANMFSRTDHALFIYGSEEEVLKIAACIHNEGPRCHGGFLDLDMGEMTDQEQKEQLFSEQGAAAGLEEGTLLLKSVENASPQVQKSLFYLIHSHMRRTAREGKRAAHVRVLLASRKPLALLYRDGKILEELYNCLEYFCLEVPSPIYERAGTEAFIRQKFKELCGRYERYHILTAGGMEELCSQDWAGESLKLESFLERLILESSRRSIDEVAVYELRQSVLEEGRYLLKEEIGSAKKGVSKEEERILEALDKSSWRRGAAAESLGISKSTLWRKMKRYRILPPGSE